MKIHGFALAALLGFTSQAVGAFGWGPYQIYDIAEGGAEAVVVGDVDGDGLDDVVLTGSGGDHNVYVFFQRANGTLDPPVILDSLWQFAAYGLVMADFDHDGIEDFVVGSGDGITLFMGNAARELSGTHVSGPEAPLLAAMDVDRDGHVDVLAASWGQGAYTTIYHGNGSGGIREQSQLPAPEDPVFGFKTGDLNSDGFDDLAITTENLYIYLHDRVSGFEPTPLIIQANSSFSYIGGMAIGDFDDDGRNDVVIGNRANSPTNISIYLQAWTNAKRPGPVDLETDGVPLTMLSSDLDGDGRDDLLVMHDGFAIGSYLQGVAGLQPEMLTETHTSINPAGMSLGDINSDGCKDLAIASGLVGLVVLHGNDCELRPDLMVAAGLTSTTAAIRIEHIWGEISIQEPLVQLDLSVLSGTLQTGTLPDDCVVQAQTEHTRRIECLAATLESGTSTTLLIPINVTGGGQSNPLTAAVEASTDTPERSLANNQAEKTILLNPDRRVPVPSTRLRSKIGQGSRPPVSGLPAQPTALPRMSTKVGR